MNEKNLKTFHISCFVAVNIGVVCNEAVRVLGAIVHLIRRVKAAILYRTVDWYQSDALSVQSKTFSYLPSQRNGWYSFCIPLALGAGG